MKWTVYLSGEIHTDWRDQIMAATQQLALPIEFRSAVTDHEASDAAPAWTQSPGQVVEIFSYVVSKSQSPAEYTSETVQWRVSWPSRAVH